MVFLRENHDSTTSSLRKKAVKAMTDRSGILTNSPLVLALASIRFAPWQLMAKKIDEIHDELRGITPLIHHIQVQTVRLDGQAVPQAEAMTPTAWILMSADRSFGIQLTPEQLLVFTKKYSRYVDFDETIKEGLRVLLKHMRFIDVVATGVRYVDHIVMEENELHTDYLASSLLPVTFDNLKIIGGNSIWRYKSGEADLQVRCISQPDALTVPEDVLSIFAMSQDPGNPLKLDRLGNGILLDIDAFMNYSKAERMTERDILGRLNSLHKEANAFFRHESVCTDNAFNVWRRAV